jgi:hypothetical protein
MEIHHPHHVTHKKKWNEYLLEFCMLFLAVFLGFVAENIRENGTDREKEKQYMESMLEDLKNDTAIIAIDMRYTDSLINGLGITFNAIHDITKNNGSVQRLYEDYIKNQRLLGFHFHDATETEMKNADGLRLVRKKNVAEKIVEYWKQIEVMRFDQTFYNEHEAKNEEIGNKIFDKAYIIGYYPFADIWQVQIDSAAKLITNDPATLLELANGLWTLRSSLENWYMPGIKITNQVATELIDLIKKEYNIPG